MASAGTAYVDVRGDFSQINRELTTQGSRMRQTFARWGKLAGVAVAGAAVVGIKKSIEAASDLEESINKAGATFEKSAPKIEKWSTTTADGIGLAQQAALEGASSIGAMLKPMGVAPQRAAAMSRRMVQLAADMASFNNEDPTEMLDRIRAGLTGESEPLKRFGTVLSETRVQQHAWKVGIADASEELTEQQKIMGRYSLLLKDTRDQQGDFARTSDSLANQQRILKANLEELAASIGRVLLPVAKEITTVLLGLVQGIPEIVRWFKEGGAAADALKGGLAALGASLFAMKVAVPALALGLRGLGVALLALRAPLLTITLLARANPLGLLVTALTGVGAAAGALGLFSSETKKAKTQSERAADAYKAQRESIGALKRAVEGTVQAKRRDRRAADAVEQAEARLREARERFPANSEQVVRAEMDVVRAKRRSARATEALKRAEELEGVEKKIAMRLSRASAQQLLKNIGNLRQQRKRILENVEATGIQNINQKGLRMTGERLDEITQEINRSQGRLNRVQKTAAEQINPKFARGLREMSDRSRSYVDRLKGYQTESKKATDRTEDFGKETKNLGDDFRKTSRTTKDAMKRIGENVNRILSGLGVKKVDFRLVGLQRGGLIPGYGVGDKVPVMAEPGEGFINKRAVQALGGRRVIDWINTRFARFQRGGMVEPPGDPGAELVARPISRAVGSFLRRFGLDLTAGYDPGGGHVSPGHNIYGTALDIVPGPGGSWDSVDRAVQWAVGQGMKVLYDGRFGSIPWPNHGRGNHAHIEWTAGARVGPTELRRLRVEGPPGALRDMIQGAADRVRGPANRYIREQFGRVTGAHGQIGAGGIAQTRYASLWQRAAPPGLDPLARLMSAIVMAESSGVAGAFNGIARGPYQFTAGTWADFGRGAWTNAHDPWLATQAAVNVLQREGRAGLNRWDVYRFGTHSQFLQRGGVVQRLRKLGTDRLLRRLRDFRKATARINERIEIAQELAALPRSPGGEELADVEKNQQLRLYSNLLERQLTKRGLLHILIDRFRGRRERREGVLDRIRGRRAGTAKGRERLRERRGEISQRAQAATARLKALQSELQELEGFTGRGGEIFQTKLALRHLRQAPTSGALAPMTIADFQAFVEAIRYGVFERQPPRFHQGGWVRPPAGRSEMPIMAQRGEYVQSRGEAMATRMPPEVRVYIGDRELTDIVRIEMRERERSLHAGYRAGRMR